MSSAEKFKAQEPKTPDDSSENAVTQSQSQLQFTSGEASPASGPSTQDLLQFTQSQAAASLNNTETSELPTDSRIVADDTEVDMDLDAWNEGDARIGIDIPESSGWDKKSQVRNYIKSYVSHQKERMSKQSETSGEAARSLGRKNERPNAVKTLTKPRKQTAKRGVSLLDLTAETTLDDTATSSAGKRTLNQSEVSDDDVPLNRIVPVTDILKKKYGKSLEKENQKVGKEQTKSNPPKAKKGFKIAQVAKNGTPGKTVKRGKAFRKTAESNAEKIHSPPRKQSKSTGLPKQPSKNVTKRASNTEKGKSVKSGGTKKAKERQFMAKSTSDKSRQQRKHDPRIGTPSKQQANSGKTSDKIWEVGDYNFNTDQYRTELLPNKGKQSTGILKVPVRY